MLPSLKCAAHYTDLTDQDLEELITVVVQELTVKHGARCTRNLSYDHLKYDTFGEVFKEVRMMSTNPT